MHLWPGAVAPVPAFMVAQTPPMKQAPCGYCGIFDEPVKWDDILDVGQLLTFFLANYLV